MPATAPAVELTKSMIFDWPTDHLEDAAGQWAGFASQSDEVFSQHLANVGAPSGTEWTGTAATSAYDDARDAQEMVRVRSSIYRECTSIARRGAGDVRGARQATIGAILDAEDMGYVVNEDLSVTDSKKVLALSQEYMDRKAEAQRLSEFIRWRATGLASTDARVAGELQAKATELQGRWLVQGGDHKTDRVFGVLELPPGLSEQRRKAVEYADKWANGNNPEYPVYSEDCTGFVSQALRAGGFKDVGDDLWDWNHGDRDDWYYKKGSANRWNRDSETWYNAAASHDYFTQRSGLGEIKGVVATPARAGLDLQAPSKAGLVPGDLIYYKNNTGDIDHVAMYVGQVNGVDVVDQHSGEFSASHDDWMPDTRLFTGGQSRVEFVHLKYPGE